jgi:hypothetical protein
MLIYIVHINIHIYTSGKTHKKIFFLRSFPLTNRDEMSNLHRGHSIDASYQVSVHLIKWFQRKRFFYIGQSEKRIACGGHVW